MRLRLVGGFISQRDHATRKAINAHQNLGFFMKDQLLDSLDSLLLRSVTSATADLSISSFVSAERMETDLSRMDRTTPIMPLLVTILSPGRRALRRTSSSLAFLRWGAMSMTYMRMAKKTIMPIILICWPV